MNGQRLIYSEREFARLGTGQVAYIKKINTDELARCFPELPPMTPGIDIWGLFGMCVLRLWLVHMSMSC